MDKQNRLPKASTSARNSASIATPLRESIASSSSSINFNPCPSNSSGALPPARRRARAATREVKASSVFGGLVADGFLIVAGRKQNLVDQLGRVLIREARGLGVGDSVTRHSASLSELGRAGKWQAVRKELSATQDDVETAMVALRDEKLAALISLGGWLRGLEITSAAVEANYSPERAKTLQQPELVEYFAEELATLPPQIEHAPIFESLRKGVKAIRSAVGSEGEVLRAGQVEKLHAQAREMDLLLLQNQ